MSRVSERAILEQARPGIVASQDGGAEPQTRINRIGVFGLFGIGNYGNDGSLEAMLRLLRAHVPAASIICICGDPEKISRRYLVDSVGINFRPKRRLLRLLNKACLGIPGEIISLKQTLQHIRKLDLLVIPGTGILDDYFTGPLGMPYWLFRWTTLARLAGTKVAFVSIGAGPITHPLSRWLMKTTAEQADYVTYRDSVSYNFMRSIGCDVSRHAIFPDLAFSLPAPSNLKPTREEGNALTVGVGVMTYNGWRGDRAGDTVVYDNYIGKMVRFANWLFSKGYRVRLLMGDDTDQATVEKLLDEIRGPNPENSTFPVIAELSSSLHDVMRQMAETDVVIATRYHNIVCSLKICRPTLSIGYAAKNDVLLQSMGLEGFCQPIEDLDFDLLTQQFERLVASRKSLEHTLEAQNDRVLQELQRQQDILLRRYFSDQSPVQATTN